MRGSRPATLATGLDRCLVSSGSAPRTARDPGRDAPDSGRSWRSVAWPRWFPRPSGQWSQPAAQSLCLQRSARGWPSRHRESGQGVVRAIPDIPQGLRCLAGETDSPLNLRQRLVHGAHRTGCVTLDRFDHRADFLSGERGPFRELAYFIGDDREASSLLSGTRRLNCRVQGEQIGLGGDLSDDAGDRGNLVGPRL